MQQDFLILGAGLAGLSCAQHLQQEGYRVTLLDKARGPGGRLASKRLEGWQFDMGAQYFTARSDDMQQALQTWLARGWVAPWQGNFAHWHNQEWQNHTGAPRYVGQPRMSALSRGLCADLTLLAGQAVTHLEHHQGEWQVSLADGTRQAARGLISTLPLPQLRKLLEPIPALHKGICPQLPNADYQACWALAYRCTGPWPSKYASISLHGHPLLDFIAYENSKPGRGQGCVVSVQCNPVFSAAHLDISQAELSHLVLQSLTEILGQPLQVEDNYAHRWLYARAMPATEPSQCLWLPDIRFGAAGDIFSAGKVEGAWLSGLALARRIVANPD